MGERYFVLHRAHLHGTRMRAQHLAFVVGACGLLGLTVVTGTGLRVPLRACLLRRLSLLAGPFAWLDWLPQLWGERRRLLDRATLGDPDDIAGLRREIRQIGASGDYSWTDRFARRIRGRGLPTGFRIESDIAKLSERQMIADVARDVPPQSGFRACHPSERSAADQSLSMGY